jgi:hypothetical protein
MDIPGLLVLLIVGAGILAWVTSPRTAQALESFGLGFIGYRSYGWPRGVQEEDEVHFSFDDRRDPLTDQDDQVGLGEEAELIELSSAPEAVSLERPR